MMPNFPKSRGSELVRNQQHLNPQHQNLHVNVAPHQNQVHLSISAFTSQRYGYPLPNKQVSSNKDYTACFLCGLAAGWWEEAQRNLIMLPLCTEIF